MTKYHKALLPGTWDLFHVGHLNLIEKASEICDDLIVAISTDELVESYKNRKPIIKLEDRKRIVEACKYVGVAIVQKKLVDINQLILFNIDVVVLGDDWDGKYLEGVEWSKQHKSGVVYFPYTQDVSTTDIKNKILGDKE